MKNFRECLQEHSRNIINFRKKKIKLLTNEQQELYENAKICYTGEKRFEDKYAKDKIYLKVSDNCLFTVKNRGTYKMYQYLPKASYQI